MEKTFAHPYFWGAFIHTGLYVFAGISPAHEAAESCFEPVGQRIEDIRPLRPQMGMPPTIPHSCSGDEKRLDQRFSRALRGKRECQGEGDEKALSSGEAAGAAHLVAHVEVDHL
jgi:hypothetical protein